MNNGILFALISIAYIFHVHMNIYTHLLHTTIESLLEGNKHMLIVTED